MVLVAPPPPRRRPNPIFHVLPSGTHLIRLFDPFRHSATAVGFRHYGPLLRFDHHRSQGKEIEPGTDTGRGIYYAAPTLSSCLVEIFGDTGVIDLGRHCVASPLLRRDLRLLDLRGRGAMRAGTKSAIAKVPNRTLSQTWSRYSYETTEIYTKVDGLIYPNAHNDEEALALYERAEDALKCPPDRVMRLDDEALYVAILEAANDNDLIVVGDA